MAASGDRGAGDGSPLELPLLAVGIVTLIGWIIVRSARPAALKLTRAPGRPNNLTIVHVLIVWLAQWLAVGTAYAVGPLFRPDVEADPVVQASILGFQLGQWGAPTPAAHLARTAGTALVRAPGKAKLGLVALIAGSAVALAGSVLMASITFSRGVRRGLGLDGRRAVWDAGRAAVAFLAVFPLCWGAGLVMMWLIKLGLPVPPTPHALLEFLATASAGWKLLIVFGAVVMAPLGEELLYRGLLQSMLRRYCRPWWAIAITSAVFAVAHVGLYKDWPALFVLSVALGYNYERTGRLIAPILLHALFNAAMICIALTA